jgi:ribonuclease R
MSKKGKSTLEKMIIDFLDHYPGMYIPVELIASALKMHDARDSKQLNKTIQKMIVRQMLKENKSGHVKPSINEEDSSILEGVLDVNRHGTGFVNLQGYDQDIRIPSKKMGVALPGDLVRIKLSGQSRSDNRQEGRVLDVKKRANRIFVGTLVKEKTGTCYIVPDEKSAQTDFFVHPDNTMGANSNDKVIFKLLDWIHPRTLPEATVIQNLGNKKTNDAAILSILAENQIVSTFPKAVDEFAEKIATKIPASEYPRRLDLRQKIVFTIDPVDAKDFDDALSIEVLDSGNYYLGVHIADVTHYVNRQTLLDNEALERGTSVYLVDRVIPMLPESLSNGVCSLRPNEEKLCYSCFMEVTPTGSVVAYDIRETVIESKFRFTYEQAQEVIDGKEHEFSKEMNLLLKLSKMLTENRFKHGAMDFDSPEPRFELDEKGHPLSVVIKQRLDAHRLVEECMLLANKTVSIHIEELRNQAPKSKVKDKNLYPFLYRIHDKPDPDKLLNVAENVGPIGIAFKPNPAKITSKVINELLQSVKGHPLQNTINELVLRSMAKAVYSPKNIGHFGLHFKHYTHFTSPIRRYPDIIVHRLLKSYAAGVPSYRYSDLEELGFHCSEREKMAVSAERDSIKLKQVEFMSDRIGQTFDGTISGVTDKGLYVVLKDVYCEGMIRISDLDDDYYNYEANRHILRGRTRGRTYQLGADIKVKVFSTNMEQRTIDFVLSK